MISLNHASNEISAVRGCIRGAGIVGLCIALFAPVVFATKTSVTKNPDSGLLAYSVEDEGISIELIQLLPDFVRAVYTSHNLPKAEVEDIASYCVFGTILRNTSDGKMSYRVADWRTVGEDGIERPIKTKTQWIEQWRRAGVTFSWTLLPDSGDFEVGDWQQGFTTVKMPRDSAFDLIYQWKLDGEDHVGRFENMRCAPEKLEK
jgi:hypothetical protein